MRTRYFGFLVNLCIVFLMVSSGAVLADTSVPTASADAGPDQIVDVNTVVNFDGSGSSGEGALEYTWYFRDGAETTVNSPYTTHTYSTEGVYEVGLLVKDGNGYYDLDTVQIRVKNSYPVADAGDDITANEDEVIEFDGSGSSDIDDDIIYYGWNFEDGPGSHSIIASKSYKNAGIYYARLTVIDNDDAYDVDTTVVTIINVEPTADGVANDDVDDELTVYEDDLIDFDASPSTDTASDAPDLTYAWDFDDGSKAKGMTVSHTYTKAGVYYATLRVTDDNDAYTEDVITINVLNADPEADAGPDQVVYEGDTILFDGKASSDTPTDSPLLGCSWDLPNQGTSPTHSWYDDSTHDVELLLTDDDGDTDPDSTTISVLNAAPTASVHTAYIPVSFELRTAGAKGNTIVLEVLEGSMVVDTLEMTRQPGDPDEQTEDTQLNINIAENALVRVSYTPGGDPPKGKANGASPVWVELTFEDGTSTTLFRSFNANKPQEWVWDIDMGEHLAGKAVHFQATAHDPGMDDLTFTWDFGDGTTISNHFPYPGVHPFEVEDDVVHLFSELGPLTMTLTVEDEDGGVGTDILLVDSQKDCIYVDNVAPTTECTSDKLSVMEDEMLTFSGTGHDTASDMSILSYHWDFGDGNTATGDTAAHSYEYAGVYTVMFTVTDDSGDYAVDHVIVEVLNTAPVAVPSVSDTEINEDDTVNFDASSSTDTLRDVPKLIYAWDFGDGNKGCGITTSHVYTNCGVYTVTLTVQDDNGATSTDSVQITVNNVAPYGLNLVTKGLVVEDEFNYYYGSAIDTPSDEALLVYDWDFGDGTQGHGMETSHKYTLPGIYTVKLTVTDDDLSSSYTTTQITVLNMNPVAYAGATSLSVYGPEVTIEFEGRGFDTFTDQSSLYYRWDLGGGVIKTTQDVTVTFSTSGPHLLTFEVYDIHSANSNMVTIGIWLTLDSDGDAVLDHHETILGTDPYLWDTDSDNLMDYFEIYLYPTDPRISDTDYDELNDWYEITNFGVSDPDEDDDVNPLDWDSDGDWVIDSQDTDPLVYNDIDGTQILWDAIKVENDICEGVSVIMYDGSCSAKPTITETTAPTTTYADIGIFLNIGSTCTPPFNAQIRVRYDESDLPSGTVESNLALYYWSSADTMWKYAGETGVDTTHNFVWSKVTRFSIFAVMDSSKMDSDDDGLQDGYELSKEYKDIFVGGSINAYTSGTPLYIKTSRLQVQIPAEEIKSASGLVYGTVDLLDLGYIPYDFSTSNNWQLTDGLSKLYVSVATPPLIGFQEATLTFNLYTTTGYNYMRIDTICKTDPFDPDSDDDGLNDGLEVNTYNTDPLDTDSDNDGWSDGAEVNKYKTDPNDYDSDNDGVKDSTDYNPLVNLRINVLIKEILQHDWVDIWPWQYGDFYLKVCIDGTWYSQSPPGILHDVPHEFPDWSIWSDIPDNKRYIPIKIELWDDDPDGFPLYDDDDKMDISRVGPDVDISYDVKTGRWTGDDYLGDRNGVGHTSGLEDGSYDSDEDDCDIYFSVFMNDCDSDLIPYWVELDEGTDFLGYTWDYDSDGMPDWFENKYGLNYLDASDANVDTDNDRLTNKEEYQRGTDPKMYEVNLWVTVMWDVSTGYLERIASAVAYASNYLYDVTDGHLYIRCIFVSDKSQNTNKNDLQVHPGIAWNSDSSIWPHSKGVAGIFETDKSSGNYVVMPDWIAWGGLIPMDAGSTYWKQTLAHEFGHSIIGSYDEYCGYDPVANDWTDLPGWKQPPTFMNDQTQWSEMSTPSTYTNTNYRETAQWVKKGKSTWETFYDNFDDKLWFDFNRDGTQDTAVPSNYAPIGGPSPVFEGGYIRGWIYDY